MLQAVPGTTYRDVFEKASQGVTKLYRQQHPQMEGVPDRELFGVTEIKPLRFVPVTKRQDDLVTLAAGAAHGLEVGARWAVYPQSAKAGSQLKERLGVVELSEVRAVSALGRVVEEKGKRPIAVGDRAVEQTPALGAQSLLVDVAPAPGGTRER